jgi:hypothetical protein
MTSRLLLCCSGLLLCSVANGSELAKKDSPQVPTTPLKAIGTVPPAKGGFLAWLEPVKTDDKGNAYLLVLPEIRRHTDPNAEIPRPRDVVRISADGKERTTLSPIKNPKLATATMVTTAAIALDPHGELSMLVWARWRDASGGEEKRGQYIVSFDNDGDYRSEVEVDWRELGVMQFEAFGSGRFLLRGRWTNAEEIRLAILSPTGSLQDIDWSERPSQMREPEEPNEPSTPRRTPSFGQMVRGGDGRIYVTHPGERPEETIIYAVSASGHSEKVYTLRPMLGDLPLVGMRAAGDRIAAVYLENSGDKGRWWIAVYSNAVIDPTDSAASHIASPLAVYGPAPGVPVAYRLEESSDRFTFLKGGNFMTMSP